MSYERELGVMTRDACDEYFGGDGEHEWPSGEATFALAHRWHERHVHVDDARSDCSSLLTRTRRAFTTGASGFGTMSLRALEAMFVAWGEADEDAE